MKFFTIFTLVCLVSYAAADSKKDKHGKKDDCKDGSGTGGSPLIGVNGLVNGVNVLGSTGVTNLIGTVLPGSNGDVGTALTKTVGDIAPGLIGPSGGTLVQVDNVLKNVDVLGIKDKDDKRQDDKKDDCKDGSGTGGSPLIQVDSVLKNVDVLGTHHW